MRIVFGHSTICVGQILVRTALAFFCLTLPLAALAASDFRDDYLIDVWQTDDGLPQNEVTSIAQTPEGYLWIGLFHAGLARFDGIRFAAFNPFNTPEIMANEIQALSVDARGVLWIGPSDASLTTWSRGKFTLARPAQSTEQRRLNSVVGIHSNQIFLASVPSSRFAMPLMVGDIRSNSATWAYYQAKPNPLPYYFCMDRDGVVWFRTAESWLGQLQNTQFVTLPRNLSLPGQRISTLCTDVRGKVWVGSEAGIASWESDHFQKLEPTNGETRFSVMAMVFSGDNGLWVLEENGRLRKCLSNAWVVVTEPGSMKFKPSTRRIQLHGDRDGGLWLVNHGEGVWHVWPDGTVQKLTESNGLPSARIECWFQDKEGNIWLGTSSSGVVRLRKRTFHVLDDNGVLPDKIVRSVWEDPSGAVWMGTASGLVAHWQEEIMTPLNLATLAKPPIIDVTVCGDRSGRLWIGTVHNGVLVRENGILRRPFPVADVNKVARVLYADRQGRMWFGSEYGLSYWQDGKLKKFGPGEIGNPCHVTGIAEDPEGAIWISTATCHLLRFSDGKFQNFASPSSFWKTHFWCLACDAKGGVWVGTLGGGLVRFQNGKFVRISSEQGLPNDHISQLLDDGQGNLWAGSRGGIISMELQRLNEVADEKNPMMRSVLYNRADGLPTVECGSGFQPGCWRGQDGRLWFSTVKGLVWIQPGKLNVSPLPAPVLIEEVRVDGAPGQKMLKDGQAVGQVLSGKPDQPAISLRLGPGQHYVEFHFASPTLANPDKIRFKWKMEGLDTDWIQGGSQRMVGYSSLPPGTYTFLVTACNGDGNWNENPDAVSLIIQPHVWQFWWFKASLALLAGGLLWILIALRISRIRALQRDRLRIARDLHDEIGAGLGTIALLGEFIEQTPTTNDGREVRHLALQTIESLRDIVWFVDPSFDRLNDLVSRMQTTAKTRLPGMELDFRQIGDFKGIKLTLVFRRNVLPLFKEALHNIVKHAQATRVEILVCNAENEFQLSIHDNGRGFDPGKSGDGSGLKNMQRRAKEMQGRLEILHPPAGGTTIRLTAPLP